MTRASERQHPAEPHRGAVLMPFPVSDAVIAGIAGVVIVGVFAALLAGCGAAPPRIVHEEQGAPRGEVL